MGKTFMLGRLPLGQQVVYGTATDFIYEVNKRGTTDQSVKTEIIGSITGSSASVSLDRVLINLPNFNGVTKIITNTIVNDIVSDKTKEKYKDISEGK